jgi:hypothetical protein
VNAELPRRALLFVVRIATLPRLRKLETDAVALLNRELSCLGRASRTLISRMAGGSSWFYVAT